jgi:hypothetical protein
VRDKVDELLFPVFEKMEQYLRDKIAKEIEAIPLENNGSEITLLELRTLAAKVARKD